MSDSVSLYDRLMAVKPDDLAPNKWALEAGLNRNTFTNIRNRGDAHPRTVAALLDRIGISEAEFAAGPSSESHTVRSEVRATDIDTLRDPPNRFRPNRDFKSRTLELIGTAHGGEYGDLDEDVELTELHLGEVIEYLARPVALANDVNAYALTIVGDSMIPRYRPGERVAVSPRSVVAIGDDVIVQLRGPDGDGERIKMVLIKELVRRTATYVELRQYRPDMTFRVELPRVAAMHKVSSNFF